MSAVMKKQLFQYHKKDRKQVAALKRRHTAYANRVRVLTKEVMEGIRSKPRNIKKKEWEEQTELLRCLGFSTLYEEIDKKKQQQIAELKALMASIDNSLAYSKKLELENPIKTKPDAPVEPAGPVEPVVTEEQVLEIREQHYEHYEHYEQLGQYEQEPEPVEPMEQMLDLNQVAEQVQQYVDQYMEQEFKKGVQIFEEPVFEHSVQQQFEQYVEQAMEQNFQQEVPQNFDQEMDQVEEPVEQQIEVQVEPQYEMRKFIKFLSNTDEMPVVYFEGIEIFQGN